MNKDSTESNRVLNVRQFEEDSLLEQHEKKHLSNTVLIYSKFWWNRMDDALKQSIFFFFAVFNTVLHHMHCQYLYSLCGGRVECNLGSHPRKKWITSLWPGSNCLKNFTEPFSAVISNSLVRDPVSAIKAKMKLHILSHDRSLWNDRCASGQF